MRNSGIHNINFSGVTASDADHDAMKIQTTLLTHCQIPLFLRHSEGSAYMVLVFHFVINIWQPYLCKRRDFLPFECTCKGRQAGAHFKKRALSFVNHHTVMKHIMSFA